jgi:hypothetical protein
MSRTRLPVAFDLGDVTPFSGPPNLRILEVGVAPGAAARGEHLRRTDLEDGNARVGMRGWECKDKATGAGSSVQQRVHALGSRILPLRVHA